MNTLLTAVIKKQSITNAMIEAELYDICDRVHSSCDQDCPVYDINCGIVDSTTSQGRCACFKDGTEMLKFIRAISD